MVPTAELNERPPEVSHLLAADDVLNPGSWGAHIAVCGAELYSPMQDEDSEWSPENVRYCPECVREAHRWVGEVSHSGEGRHPS